ncbi:hypothetical protein, partial [Mycobacterium avium]|uniref:hypothetical protein n=1 Tax=Mycobacterium avium TaxID=1764 RepID=UPI001F354D5E
SRGARIDVGGRSNPCLAFTLLRTVGRLASVSEIVVLAAVHRGEVETVRRVASVAQLAALQSGSAWHLIILLLRPQVLAL